MWQERAIFSAWELRFNYFYIRRQASLGSLVMERFHLAISPLHYLRDLIESVGNQMKANTYQTNNFRFSRDICLLSQSVSDCCWYTVPTFYRERIILIFLQRTKGIEALVLERFAWASRSVRLARPWSSRPGNRGCVPKSSITFLWHCWKRLIMTWECLTTQKAKPSLASL